MWQPVFETDGSDHTVFAPSSSTVGAFSDVKCQVVFSSYLFVTNVVITPTSDSAVSCGSQYLKLTGPTARCSHRPPQP